MEEEKRNKRQKPLKGKKASKEREKENKEAFCQAAINLGHEDSMRVEGFSGWVPAYVPGVPGAQKATQLYKAGQKT